MEENEYKEQLSEILKKANGAIVMHSKKWKYPSTGDDPIKCPMLDFMLRSEQKAGWLIFIPDTSREK